MDKIFLASRQAWNDGTQLRAVRRRLKNYTYGRQWDDLMTDAMGNVVTEGQNMTRSGQAPITHNLLRSFVKTVVGRFRHNLMQIQNRVQDDDHVRNHMDELDARELEEFLISGCAIQRVVREHRPGGEGLWVDNVSPARFFCNDFRDVRGCDVQLVGMLHEMSLTQVLMMFSHGRRWRRKMIEDAYDRCEDKKFSFADGTSPIGRIADDENFAQPTSANRCRVIETWTLETDNRGKLVWHARWYAPDGTLLDETDSPYGHGQHPFVFKFYPLTDGEVHPFIEDVIDQQRYINRLINIIDHIMSASAKGVLLFPIDSVPAGYDYADVLAQWNRPGGVIPIDPAAQRLPTQVESTASDAAAHGLLDIELKLIQQVSGVSGALQGQGISGAMNSATLYQAQATNSSIALLDIFETFNSFRRERDRKLRTA